MSPETASACVGTAYAVPAATAASTPAAIVRPVKVLPRRARPRIIHPRLSVAWAVREPGCTLGQRGTGGRWPGPSGLVRPAGLMPRPHPRLVVTLLLDLEAGRRRCRV